jgi:hypothetical protein
MAFRRVRKISKNYYEFRHVCPSVRLSSCNNTAPTGRNFVKFDISVFVVNLSRKLKFRENITRIAGTVQDDKYIYFYHISLNSSLKRNVSNKFVN